MSEDPNPEPGEDAAAWEELLAWREARRAGTSLRMPDLPGILGELYQPLLHAFCREDSLVVAHLGQSLDGRIATASGASQWITGEADLLHTHRMRALADAVVIGAGTALADDPLLTVRRCPGANPVRVVIDASGRLRGARRIFDESTPTIQLLGVDAAEPDGGGREHVRLPTWDGRIAPQLILAELRRRGLRWIFIEGGGITVSRFLADQALDRLQLVLAPVILGSGRPSLILPEITDPGAGMRPRLRHLPLGGDLLIECIFR